MDYTKIKVADDGPVTVITLADPATMNAASVEMATELTDAFRRVDATESIRAVVLTGEGRGFCSGANLSGGGAGGGGLGADGRPDAGSSLETVYNPLVTHIRGLGTPLVVAVNGAAAGVGCSLAMLGDLIVASQSAYFLQAFRRIGLIPDGGSTYMLPRIIGKARAMEMALLGERLPAAQALEWGLINRCVPDAELMPTAIWAGLESDWTDQLAREAKGQTLAGRTEDFREGVTAFLQKRPAAFKGR
jgi:2-(1,2-epoxy-1,2-dihydrophenyl)acetyl-CoA isomerase